MKINTPKIESEMARLGITFDQLGAMITPPVTRQGAEYLAKESKSLVTIKKVADALNLDPKDLII